MSIFLMPLCLNPDWRKLPFLASNIFFLNYQFFFENPCLAFLMLELLVHGFVCSSLISHVGVLQVLLHGFVFSSRLAEDKRFFLLPISLDMVQGINLSVVKVNSSPIPSYSYYRTSLSRSLVQLRESVVYLFLLQISLECTKLR